MRWRTFGFKRDGGYDDQEAEYLDGIEVCKRAYEMAEWEAKEEQRQRQEAEAKRKKPRRRL